MSSKTIYRLQKYGTLLVLKAVVMGEERDPRILRLLIDTGSSFTVLSAKVLEEIGCHPATPNKQISIMAAGGVIQAPAVQVPTFSCVGQQIQDFSAISLDLPFNPLLNGLLGMDFLQHCGAMIDIKKAEIRVQSESE
jgi:predicted aspartyl protease